jgi:magnesium transporter
VISVSLYHREDVSEHTPAEIGQLLDRPGVLWVDVAEPTEDDLECLEREFRLHPLAMEDVRQHHQRPKLERYPTHCFLVAYSNELQEVDLFFAENFVITIREHDEDGQAWDISDARKRYERVRGDSDRCGPIVYVVLDAIVDGYFETLDAVEDILEDLEDRIFAEGLADERKVQEELFSIRRRLLVFRKAVIPLRDVLGVVLRGEVSWVEPEVLVHMQDIYDHLLRVVDTLDSQRELMGNAVDAHLAIISNRMNQVMKTMTSWGAILLGSTLIAGIYGMNFVHMPELQWRWGYAYAIGLMLTITIVGFWYFRRKDWL